MSHKVSDQAASLLMTDFYKALSAPNTGKVQVLGLAQIALIKQKPFENTFYWSLAGNYL
jgi:CHAT domain-containing protein